MDKTFLISMFITFATSNDILKYEPQNRPSIDLGDRPKPMAQKWPPKFCNDLSCPKYRVVTTTDDYEERIYDSSNWVSTKLTGIDYKTAQYDMFMKLFRYIGGGNIKKQKIDMTCPVTNRIIPAQGPACESDLIMSFYISPEVQAPEPTNKDVFLASQPELHVYVRQFGGYARKFDTWADEAVKLGTALNKAGLQYETAYYYTAGYNAPYQLFNRHNEIWFMKK